MGELSQGLIYRDSGYILLLLILILLFGDECKKGFDMDILFIFPIILLIGGFSRKK